MLLVSKLRFIVIEYVRANIKNSIEKNVTICTLFCFYPILDDPESASGWVIDYTNRLVGIIRLRLKIVKIGNLMWFYYLFHIIADLKNVE